MEAAARPAGGVLSVGLPALYVTQSAAAGCLAQRWLTPGWPLISSHVEADEFYAALIARLGLVLRKA